MIKYAVEFIGTFIFLSVILSQGEAIPIAVALAAVIFFGGSISGGHFNPAVSVMMNMNKVISNNDTAAYIAAQLTGAAAALYFYKASKQISQ